MEAHILNSLCDCVIVIVIVIEHLRCEDTRETNSIGTLVYYCHTSMGVWGGGCIHMVTWYYCHTSMVYEEEDAYTWSRDTIVTLVWSRDTNRRTLGKLKTEQTSVIVIEARVEFTSLAKLN